MNSKQIPANLVLHFDDMTPEEYERFKVDGLNAAVGDRNKEDGYDCPECKNKGYKAKLKEVNGRMYQTIEDCKCVPVRNAIMKMQRSGLKDVIKECTFDKWIATEEWQKTVKAAAMNYAKEPEGWFFIGGQPGCGKSHICTAISRELLLAGKQLVYMQWREDTVKAKTLFKEPEQRQSLINSFKYAEVLYIDDLFKTGKNPDGSEQRPSSADITLAFEILNYRYNKPDCLTIISSELVFDKLEIIDEAIAGRMYQRSGLNWFNIARDKAKNYRTRNQITL